MGQHQSRIGGEGTQDMGGLAVMEAVKAPAQHLAVDRHRTPLRWAGLLVEVLPLFAWIERVGAEVWRMTHRPP
jgi:hypothetical protein